MSEIKRLNKRLGRELGMRPNGDPVFMWVRTRDLYYLYETEKYQERRTPGGIIYMEPIWERFSYVRIYGDVWVLAIWKSPVQMLEDALQRSVMDPENEWARIMGSAFPYPNNGEYHPIENTRLPDGQAPTEALTTYAIHAAFEHLGMKIPDHIRAAKETLDKQQRLDEANWNDELNEELPWWTPLPRSFQGGVGDSPVPRRSSL